MTGKKIIAILILLVVVALTATAVFISMQKKEGAEVAATPDIVSSVEKSLLQGFRKQFENVKSVDVETLKMTPRHIYPNSTMVPGGGNFTLRGSINGALHVLLRQYYINGSKELAKEVFEWAMNVTEKNNGTFPDFDIACAGPRFVQGMINSGLPKDHEFIKNVLEQLKELRVADGGWVNLDYSKAKQPDGTPYSISSTEVNPEAIAAYLQAGYSLNDSLVEKAIKANDEAILKSAYMDQYYPDYIFGNAVSVILYREMGISNFDAFRKARNELIELILTKPDVNDTYLIASALIALQGIVPETSTPYKNGFSTMIDQYDKNTSTFKSGPSPIFGEEFSMMPAHDLMPLLAIKGIGYKKEFFNLSLPENPPCGEVTMAGDKVVVKSEKQPRIEWTEDNFITIKLDNMTASGGNYEYTPPAKPFHVVMNCTGYYWISDWYS